MDRDSLMLNALEDIMEIAENINTAQVTTVQLVNNFLKIGAVARTALKQLERGF
jgi:hypothetical protein